ncbi:hypothetical protein B0A48_17263 [Cryoendolithus antarcticus]|uniref:C2H2-type domain-containing protein n=1 Tax=Cryoendolithus antarcticus TaxID=1507870 RepID=A0A1V8SDE0_9PEZI|nr:hypothetical protein B0A48_17263 [Cryoendolithus antarcticus]OQO19087.1 hypothetical protein B0A51_13170 [Rachicladosporium sp. CCFEE 5018]
MSGYYQPPFPGGQRSAQRPAYSGSSQHYANAQQTPQYNSQQARYLTQAYQQLQPQHQSYQQRQSYQQSQAYHQHQYQNLPPSPPPTSSNPSSPSDCSSPQQPQPPLYVCVSYGCTSSHKRLADLQRHIERVHKVGEVLYDCHIPGCNRVGKYGIGRLDKLRDHLREKHHLDIPKRGGRRES